MHKRMNVSAEAARCVADIVDRRRVSVPSEPMVGATVWVKFQKGGVRASRIRVLVVDDSSFMRGVIARTVASDPRFEVVGQAATALRRCRS